MSQLNVSPGKWRLSLKRKSCDSPGNIVLSQNSRGLLSLSGVSDLLESCKKNTKERETESPPKNIKSSPVVQNIYSRVNANVSKTENCLDFCPNCQMPFSSLIKQSANWHISECLDIDFRKLKECSLGSSCTSTIPSHYMKYTHYQLAETKAKKSETLTSNGTSVPFLKVIKTEVASPVFNCSSPIAIVKSEVFSSQSLFNSGNLEINDCLSTSQADEIQDFGNGHFSFDENHSQAKKSECNPPGVAGLESVSPKLSVCSISSNCDVMKVELSQKDESLCRPEKPHKMEHILNNAIVQNQPLKSMNFKSPKKVVVKGNIVQTSPKTKQAMLTSFFNPLKGENARPKIEFVEDDPKPIKNVLKANQYFPTKVQVSQNAQNYYMHKGKDRSCPFYKKIPDTTFAVDAFSYGKIPGIQNYFLSHFHYDHYMGLTKNFKYPVYCSSVTANLLILKIRFPRNFIHILNLNEPIIINNVEVIALDANHCPGSIMFLFRLPDGQCILHTGDFRAVPEMEEYPVLRSCKVQKLYLDTTYCNPMYDFPSQDDVLKFITSLILQKVKASSRILVACGSYTIGKERAFMAVADSIDCKIWADKLKLNVLKCLEDKGISSRLITDAKRAQVHVLPMNLINVPKLQEYYSGFINEFDEIIGLKPTGWEHSSSGAMKNLLCIKPRCQGRVSVYGIPYSEHSSFSELRRFVQFIQPIRIIPTVNVGKPKSRELMNSLFEEWLR